MAKARTSASRVFPGKTWQRRDPADVGLDPAILADAADFAGGRGCVIRGGYLVCVWGDETKAADVASAAKPTYAHFALKAVELGLLPSLDTPAADFEPRLRDLKPQVNHKDSRITFRHFLTQTSCYGVCDLPGAAYCYNDYQMALFWDTLFLKVYGVTHETVNEKILCPMLTGPLGCEDSPSMLAFGLGDRPGRLKVSPRDFARFGWLYLSAGNWAGRQLLAPEHARLAVSTPLPLSIPRTAGHEAAMLPGQRSIGSRRIPDDHCDHDGCYSFLWWINGLTRAGRRHWPAAPLDAFTALGHSSRRGLAVLPSLDLVVSWNDSRFGDMPHNPHPVGLLLEKLAQAARP